MKQFFALAAALLIPAVLFAQDPAPDEKPAAQKKNAGPVLSPEELAARQREVGERLKKIHSTMARIASIMSKTDPEKAGRLLEALQRSEQDQNLDKIKEIENLLKEEYFNPAAESQKDLEQGLERLLDILLDRDAERNDLKEQIKKYEAISEMLEDLIQEEKDHKAKTDKFANPEKILQRAKAAMAKLDNLINRQKKLKDRTKQPAKNKDIAALRDRVEALRAKQANQRDRKDAPAQAALAKEAAQLTKDIEEMAKGLPAEVKQAGLGGGDPAAQAAKAMGRATEGMGNASARMQGGSDFKGDQKEAEQDLREASEALKRLQERDRKNEQAALKKTQERIKEDAKRLQAELERLERSAPGKDSGADDVGQAQGSMGKSGGKLGKGKRGESLPHQDEAIEDLKRAYEKLKEFEKELKRLIKLPDHDKLAKEQEDTAEKTEKVLDKMKKAGDKGEPGDGEGGGTPGQGGVEGAKKAMDRAGRNLRGKNSPGANRDQKEAVERLEKARKELEEALRQMREEEQLMLLDAIERRLVKMLGEQRKIFKDTLTLHDRVKELLKASKKPARADVDRGRQLGDGEGELAHEADKLLEILREEGSTVVIPDVVADMKSDLNLLKARLHKLKAGAYTQQIQQDVIATLKEIIEVIQDERKRREGGEGGEAGEGGEDNQDLLPTSAELKMLKALQVRVNRRTHRFERLREKEADERGHIAGKQKSVGDLTRTMADKLNQEDE